MHLHSPTYKWTWGIGWHSRLHKNILCVWSFNVSHTTSSAVNPAELVPHNLLYGGSSFLWGCAWAAGFKKHWLITQVRNLFCSDFKDNHVELGVNLPSLQMRRLLLDSSAVFLVCLLPMFKLSTPLALHMKSISIINRLPQASPGQGPWMLHDSKTTSSSLLSTWKCPMQHVASREIKQ